MPRPHLSPIIVAALTTAAVFGVGAAALAATEAVAPNLSIPIPNVTLSSVQSVKESGVPWIAQYVYGIFQYSIGVAAALAAVMMVVGGLNWMLGDPGKGKKRIQQALIGLAIALGSFLILATVNPSLVTLKNIVITPVESEDYKAMASGYGFKNPDQDAINAAEGGAGGSVPSGPAPATPPQEGDNVNVAGVDLTDVVGGPQRMARFCSSNGASLETYPEKIQALAKVVLGWKKVCVDEKLCAYYRGGYTNLRTGEVMGTLLDLPYAVTSIKNNASLEPAWPDEDCRSTWPQALACWYTYCIKSYSSAADLRQQQLAHKQAFADFYSPTGRCYRAIADQYKAAIGGAYKSHGVYGGDCGTTLVQAYSCAGARVATPFNGQANSAGAYTSGARAAAGPSGSDAIVFRAENEADLVKQITDRGGLKFGDIVNMGQQNWQHNFMFTGGRDDVPFDIFEMGGAGVDGSTGTMVNVGLNTPIGGVKIHRRRTNPTETVINYIRSNDTRLRAAGGSKSAYPIYIWRPYQYSKCTTKDDCSEGEACECAVSDCPRQQGACTASDTCSMAFTCHKVKSGGYCNTEADCPKGESCQEHRCQ